ncbi:hypothetical protein [Rhizobium sp. Root1220]|uniref:hypothetical protein n=1 Tax=Rhizobium sp. Root1220 TaxID=1736432 RepID=UPI0006F89FA4|nr:hypothetical protein [Rhizobium sp. Root1220]KQV84257.1 hypothetical protein ASC90_01670 [Rhizobium sp. Root1220]
MIALTATMIGFATAPMRSVFAMVLVGFLMCVAYGCAAFVSTTSILDLATAIVCYDGGLLLCLIGLHAIERVRSPTRLA